MANCSKLERRRPEKLDCHTSPLCGVLDIGRNCWNWTDRSRSRISSPTHRQNDVGGENETRDSSTNVRHEDDVAPRRRSSVSLLTPLRLASNRSIGMTTIILVLFPRNYSCELRASVHEKIAVKIFCWTLVGPVCTRSPSPPTVHSGTMEIATPLLEMGFTWPHIRNAICSTGLSS